MTDDIRPTSRDLPYGTYVELVASLCATRLPAAIMTVLFLVVGTLTVQAAHDAILAALVSIGALSSAARLGVLVRGRRLCDEASMSPDLARRFERSFAVTYSTFAAVFGLFAARALALPLAEWRMPVAILIVGYAAGVASTIALRPKIVVASLLLSVVPPTGVLLMAGDAGAIISAVCLIALLLGGMRSVGQRYQSHHARTTTRQAFALQARTDYLTGLGNRLALTEAFEVLSRAERRAGIAFHYVDLDEFKPVNDRLGHQTGDALLRLVADRLQTCRCPDDVVVRLGGDEFVMIQADAFSDVAFEHRAARIETVLNLPYTIEGRAVIVGASVGSSRYAEADHGAHDGMDLLLASADDVLRRRKSERKALRESPSTAIEVNMNDDDGSAAETIGRRNAGGTFTP